MLILNYLGRVLLLLAFVVLGCGVWLWLSGQDITQPAGQLWFTVHNSSLNYFQVIIQRHLGMPDLWDGFVVPYILQQPAWRGIMGSFILLMLIGRLLLLSTKPNEARRIFRN